MASHRTSARPPNLEKENTEKKTDDHGICEQKSICCLVFGRLDNMLSAHEGYQDEDKDDDNNNNKSNDNLTHS